MQEPVTSAKNLTLLDAANTVLRWRTVIGRCDSFPGCCRDHRDERALESEEGRKIADVAEVYAKLPGRDLR